jgi:hypothetical protein
MTSGKGLNSCHFEHRVCMSYYIEQQQFLQLCTAACHGRSFEEVCKVPKWLLRQETLKTSCLKVEQADKRPGVWPASIATVAGLPGTFLPRPGTAVRCRKYTAQAHIFDLAFCKLLLSWCWHHPYCHDTPLSEHTWQKSALYAFVLCMPCK